MQNRPIDKVRTTIGVRLATKYLIQERSLPSESIEDTIVRLIKSNDACVKEIKELRDLLEKYNINEPNMISFVNQERISGIIEDNGKMVNFSYIKPDKDNNEYTMDIIIERVKKDEKWISWDETNSNANEIEHIYFKIFEFVINEYYDRAFGLPVRKNLLDPKYWKKITKRVGLQESSYMNDILKIIKG
jgi:hypothetical protein